MVLNVTKVRFLSPAPIQITNKPMANETTEVKQEEIAAPVAPVIAPKVLGAAGLLTQQVKDKTKTRNAEVPDIVVNALVEIEIQARAKTITTALDAARSIENEIKKVKPSGTPAGFDANGNEVTPATYSKADVDNIKKLKERKDKLDAALDAAINGGDYSKLNDVVKNAPSNSKEKSDDKSASSSAS